MAELAKQMKPEIARLSYKSKSKTKKKVGGTCFNFYTHNHYWPDIIGVCTVCWHKVSHLGQKYNVHLNQRERSGSVVECLT